MALRAAARGIFSRFTSLTAAASTTLPPIPAQGLPSALQHLPSVAVSALRASAPSLPRRLMTTDAAAVKETWWTSASFWGGLGAAAAWGMTGSAIYDAYFKGPELISLTMTPVLIVYSSLFARWAWVVQPRNLALCACHISNVAAQCNQMRRVVEYKIANGEQDIVNEMGQQAGALGAVLAMLVVAGPTLKSAISGAGLGPLSTFAGSAAGPFTVHFWAPMSKWFISGASFLELDRPTDKISITQYSALTLTGFFFTRYALLVTPINYNLCLVNIALFGSSAWHLGRKVKADYL